MLVYAVVDGSRLSSRSATPSRCSFVARTERFVEEVRDDPEVAPKLRIEGRELEAGAR
jgi:hypothetical protein